MTPEEDNGKPPAAEGLIRGTAVSPGIGRGTAYVLACGVGAPTLRREIAADEVGGELARLDAALGQAEQDLLALKKSVDDSIGPSGNTLLKRPEASVTCTYNINRFR